MGTGSVRRTSMARPSSCGGVRGELAGEILRGDHVMRNDVRELLEPEKRKLRQHAALIGNRRGENDVEGREPVGGDDQQAIAELVDVANLAAAAKLQSGKIVCEMTAFIWGEATEFVPR